MPYVETKLRTSDHQRRKQSGGVTNDSTIGRAEVEAPKAEKRRWFFEPIKPDPTSREKALTRKLTELANSIKEHGVLQPISVDFVADGGEGIIK